MHVQSTVPVDGQTPVLSPSFARVGLRKNRPTFLTIAEVADVLRVDEATIYRAIQAGEFPAVRLRKRYIVPLAVLHQLGDDAAAFGGCIDTAEWTSSWRDAAAVKADVSW